MPEPKQSTAEETCLDRKKKLLAAILLRGKHSYLEIGMYNALAVFDDPDEAVREALQQQGELYESILNFNALMTGFQFVGLSMGQAPTSNIGVAWYFCITTGFGGNASAALLCQIAVLYIQGIKNERAEVAIDLYMKNAKYFYMGLLLSVGSTMCLVVGVNVMVHELFHDIEEPFACKAWGSTTENADGIQIEDETAPRCGPYSFLAWILNAMSAIMTVLIAVIFKTTIMAKQPGRRIFAP